MNQASKNYWFDYVETSVGHVRKSVQRSRSSEASSTPNSSWRIGEDTDEGYINCI